MLEKNGCGLAGGQLGVRYLSLEGTDRVIERVRTGVRATVMPCILGQVPPRCPSAGRDPGCGLRCTLWRPDLTLTTFDLDAR